MPTRITKGRARREPDLTALPDDALCALHHQILVDIDYLSDFLERALREIKRRDLRLLGGGRFAKGRKREAER